MSKILRNGTLRGPHGLRGSAEAHLIFGHWGCSATFSLKGGPEAMPNKIQKEKIHEYAETTLNAEIELFWKRSLFFWGFTGAAFVGYGVLIDKADKDLPLAIACFGLVCSITWTLANRGSKYWQYAWERKLRDVQKDVLGKEVYFDIVPNRNRAWWGPWRYSVTKLTIALSDFSVLVWIVLGLKASPYVMGRSWTLIPTIIVAGTGLYLVAIFTGARSSPNDHDPLPPSS